MKIVVSLNGLDKSGKTTQAQKIRDNYGLVYTAKKLRDYSGWPMLDDKELSSWWFFDGRTEDVISTIYAAVSFRNEDVNAVDCPLVLVDRGDEMFDAVCTSTFVVREGCSITEAEESVKAVKTKFGFQRPADEKVFYQTGSNPAEMLALSRIRQRGPEGSEGSQGVYSRYQEVLSTVLLNQLQKGVYTHVVDARSGINEVYTSTREIVRENIAKSLKLDALDLVVGLGGLSECGKSSMGIHLKDACGFGRIKIGSLIEDLARRYGPYISCLREGAYSVGDDLLAALFAERLNEYARTTQNRRFVIESLRSYGFTKELKRLMGPMFQGVYMSVPLELRVQRNSEDVGNDMEFSRREVFRKDRVKIGCGAHLIENVADFVIDNSGTFQATYGKLDLFLRSL